MSRVFLVVLVSLVALAAGCGGGGGGGAPQALSAETSGISVQTTPVPALNQDGQEVHGNPSGETLSIEEIEKFSPEKPLLVRVSREGTKVQQFICKFLAVEEFHRPNIEGKFIRIRLPFPIVKGDSGSPVYDERGRCIGALAYDAEGTGFYQCYVTPIETMLAMRQNRTLGQPNDEPPYEFVGVTDRFARRVAQRLNLSYVVRRSPVRRNPQEVVSPIPGHCFQAYLVRNDADGICWKWGGVLTHNRGSDLLSLGHPMSRSARGQHSLAVSLGSVESIEPFDTATGKMAKMILPSGPAFGTLVLNGDSGAVITKTLPRLGRATTVFQVNDEPRVERISEYVFDDPESSIAACAWALTASINKALGDRFIRGEFTFQVGPVGPQVNLAIFRPTNRFTADDMYFTIYQRIEHALAGQVPDMVRLEAFLTTE